MLKTTKLIFGLLIAINFFSNQSCKNENNSKIITSDSTSLSIKPANSQIQISFSKEILSIFQNNCTNCHNGEGLNLSSYNELMKGKSPHSPVIVASNPKISPLIQKLNDNPPFGSRMPLGDTLSSELVSKISLWIDQGAKNN